MVLILKKPFEVIACDNPFLLRKLWGLSTLFLGYCMILKIDKIVFLGALK